MNHPTLLVMAKAPVAGQVKTRLARDLGDRLDVAADLAAAALLDTLDACASTRRFASLRIALAGDLASAARAEEISQALDRWEVVSQHGRTFAERLARAHIDIDGPVVQVGMDTPHVDATSIDEIAAQLERVDAVLGPATDGGWWVLGWRTGRNGPLLQHIPMSVPHTGRCTQHALRRAGLRVGAAPVMTDVDQLSDAVTVATLAPHTRFAAGVRAWGLGGRAA